MDMKYRVQTQLARCSLEGGVGGGGRGLDIGLLGRRGCGVLACPVGLR
jgi:hypothetical protein